MPQLAAAQTGPGDVGDAEGGKNAKTDPPSANDGAGVGNQLRILLHAQNISSGPEDEPGSNDNAAKDRRLSDAHEASPEAFGSCDAAACFQKITEAEKIEERNYREHRQSDD